MHSFGKEKWPKRPAACARRKSATATLLNAAGAASCDWAMTLATMGHTARGPAAMDAAASAVSDSTVQREKISGRQPATTVCSLSMREYSSNSSEKEKKAADYCTLSKWQSASFFFLMRGSLILHFAAEELMGRRGQSFRSDTTRHERENKSARSRLLLVECVESTNTPLGWNTH
jgi:hypothetical protein